MIRQRFEFALQMDWEERYRKGDTPWEKGAAHPALVEWIAQHKPKGRVLIPGCGAGHEVRAFASAGAKPIGLDISQTGVRYAQSFPREGNEEYVQGDFLNLPDDWKDSFDIVFEHTCFCAIYPEGRPAYANSVFHALRPGGLFVAIFYMNPRVDEGPPFGSTARELDILFAKLSLVSEQRDLPTHEGREGRELLRVFRKT